MNDTPRMPGASEVRELVGEGAGPRRRWLRPLGWALAAVAAVALLAFLWQRISGGDASQVQYVTAPVTRGGLTVTVTATGSVQPTNEVEISSELSGTVRTVMVDYNSPVTAGDVLAVLDTDKLEATVASSKARLEAARARVLEAQATVRETERDLARQRDLAERRAVPQHDLDAASAAYDRAVAALESARADVAVAEAQLRLDQTNLVKATIRSPIDGVVLARNVEPGQTVASSFQAPVLFTIAEDLRKMELQVDVDEADVGRLKVGQVATFGVDAYPERRFPARIRDIRYAPETIQGVVTYKAVLDIDNAELLLRPGMTATAEITVERVENALLVPNAALRFSPPKEASSGGGGLLRALMPTMPRFRRPSKREATGSDRRVWVLDDGTPVEVPVKVGASDGRMTELLGGDLSEGRAVITDSRNVRR